MGWGVPQDYAQAAIWYRKAAEQGSAEAQFNLGLLYDNGLGVPLDYSQAAA
jgi:TPR repeat protein